MMILLQYLTILLYLKHFMRDIFLLEKLLIFLK